MRVFLSYSITDTTTAEQVAAHLKQAGHKVFFDRDSIKVAGDFNRIIWDEIQKADLFAFLISPNYVRAGSYTLTEFALVSDR